MDLEIYVAAQPKDAAARVARARVYGQLKRYEAAEADYNAALELAPHPTPELYIERAHVVARQGGGSIDRALQGLHDGMAKLGPLVTLTTASTELKLETGRYESALADLETQKATGAVTARWWVSRGEVLLGLGDLDGAKAAFETALAEDAHRTAKSRADQPTAVEVRARRGLATLETAAP